MNMHNKLSKALAYVLSASLIVSGISVTAFANEEENVHVRITAFSSLPGDISDQYIYVGDEESKISFPSSLNVTVETTEVITTKKEIEKEDQPETVENSDLKEKPTEELKPEDVSPEPKDVTDSETVENDENGNNSESVATDVDDSSENDIEPTVDEELITEAEPTNEPVSEPKQEETPVESDEEPAEKQIEDAPVNENETPDDQARNVFDVLMPSITVYAADSSEDDYSTESTEIFEKSEAEYDTVTETVIKTEEIIIDGVTWTIDAASSLAETFSSENAGSKFVYIPVISRDYDVAAELPRITVNVIAKEEIAEASSFSHHENVAGYSISIDAPEGVFPDGTTISINVVSNPVSLIEGEISDERNIQQIITFDISFWHDGVEIEPENGQVNVSISLASDMKETLQDESAEVQVFHIDDSRNVEEVACSSNGEEVNFSADSFSEYAVVTSTGNEKTKLDTPNNLRWVDGEAITLAWDPVDNAYYYEVGIKVGNNGENSAIWWGSPSQLGATVMDLSSLISSFENYNSDANGKTIYAFVKAHVSANDPTKYLKYYDSDNSNVISKVYERGTEKVKLATPTNLRWVDGETIILAWDPVDNAYYYEVGIKVGSNGENSAIWWGSPSQLGATVMDLSSLISSYENYNSDANGKAIYAFVKAHVNTNDSSKYLYYYDSDNSYTVSKVYVRGIVIDSKDGAHIIQTDVIFNALKDGLSTEQIAAAEGKELSFDLNISDLSSTSEGAADISNYALTNSYTIGKFFDISLTAKADGISIGNITATAAAVPLAVEIPAELQKAGRTFIILRNHDGVITEVGRGTGNQISVSTDRFSTYAIAYMDSNSDESSNSSDKDNSSNSNSTNDSGHLRHLMK